MNREALARIVDLLNKSDFCEQAKDLGDLGSKYYTSSKEEKHEISRKIKEMCHPKWLGDLYIEGISQKEWFSLLDHLSRSI